MGLPARDQPKQALRAPIRLFAPLASKSNSRRVLRRRLRARRNRAHSSPIHGWDAEGVDADPSTARFHRELGIRVRIGQFEQIEATSGYDLIHIAHAIYFITDPMDFIRGVRARLGPGGLFSALCLRISWRTPTLPYRHMFTPFFRPRHQCGMRFRSPDSKRYSVGVYREHIHGRPPRVVRDPAVRQPYGDPHLVPHESCALRATGPPIRLARPNNKVSHRPQLSETPLADNQAQAPAHQEIAPRNNEPE